MGEQFILSAAEDPQVPEWRSLVLPDAWPDILNFRKPTDLWRVIAHIFTENRASVVLPHDMPGRDRIPKYILREFHNLPNGNYSKKITRGYITGFERVMLGSMNRARKSLAKTMQGCGSVLDVGCAGGKMGDALHKEGVKDIWGIDPSPYLLQHAANDFPHVKFVQGVAEQTGFPDQRFDGITVCFLFHELPPRYLDRSLMEFHRILKSGGQLAISEPSPKHMASPFSLFRRHGLVGLYFGGLARFVYEPFLAVWHKQDMQIKLAEFGFELIEDCDQVPIRQLLARKI